MGFIFAGGNFRKEETTRKHENYPRAKISKFTVSILLHFRFVYMAADLCAV